MIPLERTHEYRGRYHVLGGALSPIDGVDPDDLRIAELYRRVAARRTRRSARSCSRPTRRRPARRPRCTSPTACASARRSVDRHAPRERAAGRLRPRVRRRGDARARLRRPPRGLSAAVAAVACMHRCDGACADRLAPVSSAPMSIVVMKFGGTSVADAERIKRAARADRRQARGGPPRRRGALGARQDDRRADRDGRGGLAGARPARDGHAALDRRADLLRAVRDGDQRPRPRGAVADRLAGRHRHRHLAHQGADPRRPRRPHHARRSTRTRSCSSPASRASRPATT